MRKVFISILLLAVWSLSLGQSKYVVKGDKMFDHYEYVGAIKQYKKEEKDAPTDYNKVQIAVSYVHMNDTELAEEWFAKVEKKSKMKPENLFKYGYVLAANGKRKQAIKVYEAYKKVATDDDEVDEIIESLNNWEKHFKDSSRYSLISLPINSENPDFSPCIYDGGILFASGRKTSVGISHTYKWDNSAFLDIFYAEREGDENSGDYAEPYRFNGAINTKFHEGPLTINKEQDKIIFTRNNYYHSHSNKSDDKVIKMGLFYSEKTDDAQHGHGWHHVKPMEFNSSEYSVQHPSATGGFDTLYFASDMPGGFGGYDIYVTYFKNGKWSKPENMGKPINTRGNDVFPFISSSGSLFYSSDGHGGMGGLDIYEAVPKEAGGYTIVDMSYPLNSENDDFGVIFSDDMSYGYLSSNRKGGQGNDDVYKFTVDAIMLTGTTYSLTTGDDPKNKEILPNSEVIVLNEEGVEVFRTFSDSTGFFSVRLPEGKYKVIANKSDYNSDEQEVDLTDGSKNVELILTKGALMVSLYVKDSKTLEPLGGAVVQVLDMTTGKEIRLTADSTGYVSFDGTPETKYVIKGNKANYLSHGWNIETGTLLAPLKASKDLLLDPFEANLTIDIKNIYFDFDRHNIRPDAAAELETMLVFFKENPQVVVELGAHTDSRGSATYNESLSQRRADACVAYLISKGVLKEKIKSKGYGEYKLRNKCADGVACSSEEHQANRRIEFTVDEVEMVDEGSELIIIPLTLEEDYSSYPSVEVVKK